ncbi:DUF169 domain-containing protein [Lagierella sp.]|uniref:DUF169 domain-containing protein n=1 Tax=Lagierella sp. TaxID=2849657 RepID=UPI0026205860|nr:DUF169 domain-containing protein [Lagierella sp.]
MKFTDIVKEINALLELDRQVVGVQFHKTKEDYDRGQGRERETMISYCSSVRDASKGKCLKLRLKNFACLAAAKACGLYPVTEDDRNGTNRVGFGAYKDLEVSKDVSEDMVYIEEENYGVSIMPLVEFETNPDVIIIVSKPFQMMRLAQGYAYSYGQLKDIKLAGMQAVCQELTSYPYIKDDVNMSMMCSGTRMLSQWNDDEMGMGIPFKYFEGIVEGLRKTVNPLERNKKKKIIEKKWKDMKSDLDIVYNQNYDDGYYVGVQKESES